MRKRFRARLLPLVATLWAGAGAVPALGDMPVTYVQDGRSLFHINAPDFWQVRAGGDRAITPPGSDEARLINRVIGLEPVAEKGVWIGFMSPNGVTNFAQAEEYLRNIGQSVVQDPTVDSTKSTRIGGLRAQTFDGRGSRDGRAVSFTAVLIDLPGDRVAISLSVVEAGANAELVNDLNAIYASFRAAR